MRITKGRASGSPPAPPTAEQVSAMTAYAAAHGLDFVPFAEKPIHPGTPFSYGKQLGITNVMRSVSDRPMEFGNFSYAWPLTGEQPLAQAWDFAYMAIKLDRTLPHISLQAKGSPVLWDVSGGIPVGPSLDQLYELEGDFNKYFYFYCPDGYERDALYVFTPDVMALFIDESSWFDAEIIDDWLFVYSSLPFRPGDTQTYDRLLRIAAVVGGKVVRQTDGYRDDRIGDFSNDTVTLPGRRLARRSPWQAKAVVIGLTAVVLLFFAIPFLLPFLLFLSALF